MSPEIALLAVIAAALVAILWRLSQADRQAMLDPRRTPDDVFRTRLADEVTLLLAPLTGLKEDLDGHGQAVEALGEATALQSQRIGDLNIALERLERYVGTLASLVAQFKPCEGCPLQVLGRDTTTTRPEGP